MPQDEGLLVPWKQQLDRDAKTLKMKGNLNHLRIVLGRCGMECEGLDTLSIKDQTLTNESSEKVVGWALSHHLMENPEADPETRVVLSAETYNAVRGYGLEVEWVDVPGIQTTKPAVSCDVASLQFELEASLAENTRLTKEATKKDEQLQAVQTQLNNIETHIGNPLHSIISVGPDTIKKLIVALSDIAEKQPQSIQEMQSTPMEGYVTLLRH